MALADLCVNLVTVKRRAWANTSGERTPSESTSALNASIQPMSTSRRLLYGLDAGVTAWVAYFPADPEVDTNDTIDWGGKVLSVLAPARDEAGRGQVFAVDCASVNQ